MYPSARSLMEKGQLLPKVSQYPHYRRIDAAQEMLARNATFEVEQIKKPALINLLPTHHDPPPSQRTSSRRNHDSSV
jgi:hypothetical protein